MNENITKIATHLVFALAQEGDAKSQEQSQHEGAKVYGLFVLERG